MAEGELAQSTLPDEKIVGMSDKTRDAALDHLPVALVITDPRQDDNPVIYVNRAFVSTTGYSSQASVGRNCRFLQGPGSEQDQIDKLRQAIRDGREITVDLTNYTADGSEFRNRLMVTPLRDDDGEIVLLLGLQLAVNDQAEERIAELQARLRELQHRVKNHLAMIVAMIRTHAGDKERSSEQIDTLSTRVEALSLLYDQVMNPEAETDDQRVSLGSYVSRVVSALQMLGNRTGLRINTDVAEVTVSFDDASRYGILLSELLTNAMQHAFPDGQRGEIRVRLACEDGAVVLSVTDNGIGLGDMDWPNDAGMGGRIASDLADRLRGRIEVGKPENGEGTRISVIVPDR